MRLKPRRIIFSAIILFILYISYKILQPEIDNKKGKEQRNYFKVTKTRENVTFKIERSDVVEELKEKYNLDWDFKLNESPWKVAQNWMSGSHVHPEYTPELAKVPRYAALFFPKDKTTAIVPTDNIQTETFKDKDVITVNFNDENLSAEIILMSRAVLNAMATWKIISADVGYKGTQLKMTVLLEGGQKAVFKPKWFSRDHVVEGPPYAGQDRHNGEIAAFHLGRLLDFRRTPLAVGRVVNLETEIKPVAKQQLLQTFFKRGNNTCFYGKCYYCKGEETGLCGNGVYMEGTIVLWLPDTVNLKLHRHPWSRTYRNGVSAQWEKDDNYCHGTVLTKPLFQEGPRLLDIIDTVVFDYIIGNADRHHYETLGDDQYAVMLILDNAKSYGNPHYDERSILAPLYQCCRIRESTWLRLHMYVEGLLSEVIESVMSTDPIAPVISRHHLRAMDRRLSTIIETVKSCFTVFSVNEVLIKNR